MTRYPDWFEFGGSPMPARKSPMSEEDKRRLQRLWDDRKRDGLCCRCGAERSARSTVHCDQHASTQRRRTRDALVNARSAGRCEACKAEPAVKGKRKCTKCVKLIAEYERRRYQERRSLGQCVFCAEDAGGMSACADCRQRQKEYRWASFEKSGGVEEPKKRVRRDRPKWSTSAVKRLRRLVSGTRWPRVGPVTVAEAARMMGMAEATALNLLGLASVEAKANG